MTIDYYLQGKLDTLVNQGLLTPEELFYIKIWNEDSNKLHDVKDEFEKLKELFHEIIDILRESYD